VPCEHATLLVEKKPSSSQLRTLEHRGPPLDDPALAMHELDRPTVPTSSMAHAARVSSR